jgi:lipopolysaccharide transport system permease protein
VSRVTTSERQPRAAERPRPEAPPTGPSAPSAKPVIEVVGGPGGVSRDALRELWLFRDVLWAFVLRNVKARYKQAALGIGWAVIQPVLAAALFALFLGRFAHVSTGGVPYLLSALVGMSAWTFFSSAASSSALSLTTNQSMLKKIYFPREIMPLSSIVASLLDLAIGFGVVVVAAALYGRYVALAYVALPLPVVLLVLTAVAFGVGLSAVNVYYRDVGYALPFLLQVGIFATPVAYPVTVVPEHLRTWYLILNPLAASIDGLRRVFIHGDWPAWGPTIAALAWVSVLALLSYALFKRLERGLSDRV